jgi:hypothetical protein
MAGISDMIDYTATIERMRDARGKLDPRLAACAFSASFFDETAGPGERNPEPASRPVMLFEDASFAEQWARALKADADPKYTEKITYILNHHVINSHYSIEFANYNGLIFNVELTICPVHIGMNQEKAADNIFRLFMKRYVEQCRRWGIKAVYYGVAEFGTTTGLHFHCGLHVPADLKEIFQIWLRKSSLSLSDGREGSSDFIRHTFRTPTIRSQWEWWRYAMKTMSPDAGYYADDNKQFVRLSDALKVRCRRPAGRVTIKRVRTSEQISWRSQARAGFEPELPTYSSNDGGWCSDRMYAAGRKAKLII